MRLRPTKEHALSPRTRHEIPPFPRIGGALRAAVRDLADNATTLALANLGWAAVLFVVATLVTRHPLGLLSVVLLVLPTAGLTAIAATQVRRERCRLADALAGMRRHLARTLGLGAAQLLLSALAAADILIGAGAPGLPGVLLIIGGGYILIAIWIYACVAWPLLLDPARADEPLPALLRVAGVIVLARPMPAIGVSILVAALLAVATLLLVPIIAFAAALATLVAARWALPAADHLQGRATLEIEVED